MLKKCTVDESGDTDLVAGTMVDVSAVDEANDKIEARIKAGEENLKKATYIPILMGITKASLATDSFLSFASFRKQQEFLPILLSKVRVTRLSVLRKMLLSVNLFRLVPVWMYSARLMLFQVIFQQKTAMKF